MRWINSFRKRKRLNSLCFFNKWQRITWKYICWLLVWVCEVQSVICHHLLTFWTFEWILCADANRNGAAELCTNVIWILIVEPGPYTYNLHIHLQSAKKWKLFPVVLAQGNMICDSIFITLISWVWRMTNILHYAHNM